MGTQRYACPHCYEIRYANLALREVYGQDAFLCFNCMKINTLRLWRAMREEHPNNEWIQEAYSDERFARVIKRLKKLAGVK